MTSPVGDNETCAGLLKVLADPTRLAVVRELGAGPRRVWELNDVLRLEPTLLSHHLRVLREAGVVRARREGKGLRYALVPGLVRGPRGRAGRALDLGCCRLSFQD